MGRRLIYQPHDLLRLRALPAIEAMPAWLPAAFADAAFVVVRRAEAPVGSVAVGFRGASRAQRHGTFVVHGAIESAISPEQLMDRSIPAERRAIKAFRALQIIAEQRWLDPLVWGPTGSVGFELATARPTATDTSDLDLLIRTPKPLLREKARALRHHLKTVETAFGLHIDAQLETPAGGIALSEWAEEKPRVMARSARGASLIADPWTTADIAYEAHR
jgi:phosphoribosyl-dephospho-CoA transferase